MLLNVVATYSPRLEAERFDVNDAAAWVICRWSYVCRTSDWWSVCYKMRWRAAPCISKC